MRIIADLHFHSRYSRAVSSQMILPEMAKWGRIKGLNLMTTADFTHPLWFKELKMDLEETNEGIYKLKTEKEPFFIFTTEIASIYSQGGKVRRIHTLIIAPNIQDVEKINQELGKRGKLMADGRPILGLSAQALAEIILTVSPKSLIIPAHAWTPHFGVYGSQSGFDSLEECFGNMSKYVYAIETGLSSDPLMNWRIKELDNRSILSFSDAHSPAKLGREATVFEVEDINKLRYEDIRKAIINGGLGLVVGSESGSKSEDEESLSNPNPKPHSRLITHNSPRISHTIEFYPEEGKYHFTGHRKCGVRHAPGQTLKQGTTCPVCGKKLTVGVLHRVDELSENGFKMEHVHCKIDDFGLKWTSDANRPMYTMLVPLMEILGESVNAGISSKKVINEYEKLVKTLGGEFKILTQTKHEEIESVSGPKIAEGISKVRSGDIFIDPGYDGKYGTVKIWGDTKKKLLEEKEQMILF